MLCVLILSLTSPLPAQTVFRHTYGGVSFDRGYSAAQTADGGYIITGDTRSFGAGYRNVRLIKTDAFGDTIWTQTYGGAESDYGYSVRQTTDGGYILAGRTNSFGAGSYDSYLVKTDAFGDTIWTRTHGGTSRDYGYSVAQTADGGYVVTGTTLSSGAGGYDVWLIKTDANGDTLWTRTYGGPDWDKGYSIRQTADGGYIITGYTASFGAGNYDVWFIKTDAAGDTMWTRIWGGTDDDVGRSVAQTADGGCCTVAAAEPVRLLVHGSIASYNIGGGFHNDIWPTNRWMGFSSYDILSLGIGAQWHGVGALLLFRTFEGFPTGQVYRKRGEPYLQVVYGATHRWTSPWPAVYAYASFETLRFRKYGEPDVGVGAKWRFYAVSPDVRISWHRVTQPPRVWPPIQCDYVKATIGLELGGLWAIRLY